MDEYTKKLYDEFLCTIDPKYITKKTDKVLFERWLDKKQLMLKKYAQLLYDMDFVSNRGVVELNKGYYDTVLKYLDKECNKILVSKFSKTVKNEKKLISVNGDISVDNKNVYLEYNDNISDISKINSYITEYPYSKDSIELLINLNNKGKCIFIGTYGYLSDLDKESKLKKLYELKNELKLNLGKNFDGEVVYTEKSYYAAITQRYNTKIKKKK